MCWAFVDKHTFQWTDNTTWDFSQTEKIPDGVMCDCGAYRIHNGKAIMRSNWDADNEPQMPLVPKQHRRSCYLRQFLSQRRDGVRGVIPEEIDKMLAGPQIDLLIAEIMEYPILDITPPCDHNVIPYMTHVAVFSPTEIHYHRALGNEGKNYSWGMWNPSKDIARAWEVVEKIRTELPSDETIFLGPNSQPDKGWWIGIWDYESSKQLKWPEAKVFFEAPTAPLAICRAALKVMMK